MSSCSDANAVTFSSVYAYFNVRSSAITSLTLGNLMGTLPSGPTSPSPMEDGWYVLFGSSWVLVVKCSVAFVAPGDPNFQTHPIFTGTGLTLSNTVGDLLTSIAGSASTQVVEQVSLDGYGNLKAFSVSNGRVLLDSMKLASS